MSWVVGYNSLTFTGVLDVYSTYIPVPAGAVSTDLLVVFYGAALNHNYGGAAPLQKLDFDAPYAGGSETRFTHWATSTTNYMGVGIGRAGDLSDIELNATSFGAAGVMVVTVVAVRGIAVDPVPLGGGYTMGNPYLETSVDSHPSIPTGIVSSYGFSVACVIDWSFTTAAVGDDAVWSTLTTQSVAGSIVKAQMKVFTVDAVDANLVCSSDASTQTRSSGWILEMAALDPPATSATHYLRQHQSPRSNSTRQIQTDTLRQRQRYI